MLEPSPLPLGEGQGEGGGNTASHLIPHLRCAWDNTNRTRTSMILKALQTTALISLSAYSLVGLAEDAQDPIDTLWIHGSIENIETLSGSASSVDDTALEQLNTADIHEVVTQVPGVYVREEDGYGLRPNIGIRGAASERSQNITLMEDGILIKPSPYAAPAAYYFPNTARMQSVDVFKGPSAVKYGPRTVGGAINMITRPAIAERNGFVELGYGSDAWRKLHAVYGDALGEHSAYLLDALHFGADGFKDLDGGGDTGFERNDINLRLNWQPQVSGTTQHQFDAKLGFANEHSHETYLGLSDADFAANPSRRYSGSQLDRFESTHQQLHLMHLASFASGLQLNTRVYLNQFERAWNKLDGFASGASLLNVNLASVLRAPFASSTSREQFELLTGVSDSANLIVQPNLGLDITNNDRDYRSRGIQLTARQQRLYSGWEHALEAGVRLHNDSVERDHAGQAYAVSGGDLVANNFTYTKVRNKGESDALALYLLDSISRDQWRYDIGLRSVSIRSDYTDYLASANNSRNDETTLLAGAGVFYQYTPALGFLAGIHRGFSPAGPARAGRTADPEESVNLEYGLRYQSPEFSGELIGFYSDYSNLIGRCRVSDPCIQGESFNGGSVDIYGIELNASYEKNLGDYSLPVNLNYTLTQSEFQSSFLSGFSQWGTVSKGDELPYTPEHTLRLDVGISAYSWDTQLSLKHRSEMREVAGQGAPAAAYRIKALTTLDWMGNYYLGDQLSLQLKVANLTDAAEIVSRRPYGARPNKPRSIVASAKYRF